MKVFKGVFGHHHGSMFGRECIRIEIVPGKHCYFALINYDANYPSNEIFYDDIGIHLKDEVELIDVASEAKSISENFMNHSTLKSMFGQSLRSMNVEFFNENQSDVSESERYQKTMDRIGPDNKGRCN